MPIRASAMLPIELPPAAGVGASAPTPAVTSGVELPITRVPQRCLNWCWAACAEMVLRRNGLNIGQCEIAMRALDLPGCCPDGAQAGCNVMIPVGAPVGGKRDVVAVYGLFGIGARFQSQPLRPSELEAELRAGRPVQACLARGGGRGHVVLVIGMHPSGDVFDPWVVVLDPEPVATVLGKVRYRELRAGLGAGLWDGSIHRIGG